MKKILFVVSLFAASALCAPSALHAADVNWENITPNKVNLFYTGTASWEFLTTKDHGVGMLPVLKKKKTCRECHISKDGTFDIRVPEIVKGALSMKASKKPLEPNPMENRSAIIDAYLQVAYDNEYVYFRMQWNSAGKSWNSPDEEKPDRIAMQMNLSQEEFSKFGCFVACHNDQNSMPESPSKDKVSKHPYYAKQKRDDVRLYAFYTRNDGWSAIKDNKALDGLVKEGGLIDLWTATVKGKKLDVQDEWILEDRQEDHNDIEGSGSWKNGKYIVILKRKLNTGDHRDAQLKDGSVVTIDIAIHDDKARLRQHYVSFPMSVGLGAAGDVTAAKIK